MTTITITIDDSGAIVTQGAQGGEEYEMPLEGDTDAPEGNLDSCPIATQNIAANLEARANAIAVANYGPLDPGLPNTDYWDAAAERWGVSVQEAKAPRCGTCAAFNITERLQACIAEGVGDVDAWGVVEAGQLGYCEAFDFKCSAARRCDAWIFGGPLTDELEQSMLPAEDDEDDTGYAGKAVAPSWMRINARRGLGWYNEGKAGDGVTDQTLREARAMAAGTVSADKAMRMAAWFARHMTDLDAPAATVGADGYPSPGVVAHALWGGGSKTESNRAAAWARKQAEPDGKVQPRVPAGSPAGGQFGAGAGGGSGRGGAAEQGGGGGGGTSEPEQITDEAEIQQAKEDVAGWPYDGSYEQLAAHELAVASLDDALTGQAVPAMTYVKRGADGKVVAVSQIDGESHTKVTVNYLAVSPASQGQGLGRQMMAHATGIAAEQSKGLSLSPISSAVPFYEKIGMNLASVGARNEGTMSFSATQAKEFSMQNAQKAALDTLSAEIDALEPISGLFAVPATANETKRRYNAQQRREMTASDFVLSDERRFPVMDAEDVQAAVASWGRYTGNVSYSQFRERLIRLARRKGLYSALPQSWREEMDKSINIERIGGAVKALGNGKIGGYLVRFTDATSPDLTGDYFTSDTELGTVEELPVLYHHGQDPMIGKRVLGRGRLMKDEIGLWVEAQLAMRDEYEASIYKLAEDGKLGWSSGAVSHLVEREQKSADVAWIKMWWVAEASLTPTPAEPRNEAATMKSGEVVTPEGAEKAPAEAATEKDEIKNTIEDTTMDNQEMAELKAAVAALTAKVDEPKIEAGKAAAVVAELGGDHDGKKAFTHWLRTGQKNYYTRTQTEGWGATKTGMNEGTAGDGGVLVPEGLYNDIIAKRDELSVPRRAGAMVIQTGLDSVQVPTENAKSAFVLRAEAAAYTESLPTFTSRLVSVYSFGNSIKASNEILADQQTNLDAFLTKVLSRALAQMENQYAITGSGSSQPLGIVPGGTAGYTFAGAAALTIADVLGLYFAMPEPYTVGSPGPVWVMRNATLALIRALTTTNFAFNQITESGSQGEAMLYGWPVLVSAQMAAATTGLKSVALANFSSSTVMVERSGLLISRNPYLYEANGQTGFFSTARFGFSVTTAEGCIYGTQA